MDFGTETLNALVEDAIVSVSKSSLDLPTESAIASRADSRGQDDRPTVLAQFIDHTLLKTSATSSQIASLCDEATRHDFKSVCVRLEWVSTCKAFLDAAKSDVLVACVVGFPSGVETTNQKQQEAINAVEAGADELDMVLNWPELKKREWFAVYKDIYAVVKVIRAANTRTDNQEPRTGSAKRLRRLKVILETGCLSRDEIVAGCVISAAAGADFVKTSTGFASEGGGATAEDVELMAKLVGPRGLEVKASGGVRSLASCRQMIQAGATRIGTSSGVLIMKEVAGQHQPRHVEADQAQY